MPRKQKPAEIEVRSLQEIRAVQDDGTFEGYITVWDTVDDWNSMFKRGAFKKTIQERGSRVKVLFNHAVLVGRSLSVREDDYGVFVQGQLNLEVEKGRDTHNHLKAKDLDTLSFGFRTIKDRIVSGVREILELALYEYGPVLFEANGAAVITDVRAQRILDMGNKQVPEVRDTDFDQTVNEADLRDRGYRLMNALYDTLWDIWWGVEAGADDITGLADEAISKFHASYLEWVNAYIAEFWTEEERAIPGSNELSIAVVAALGQDLEATAAKTSLTVDELRTLAKGKHIAALDKLPELSQEIRAAHQKIRVKAVETLCRELRAGLTPAEKRRVAALLQPADGDTITSQSEPDLAGAVDFLTDFRSNLTTGEPNG